MNSKPFMAKLADWFMDIEKEEDNRLVCPKCGEHMEHINPSKKILGFDIKKDAFWECKECKTKCIVDE